MKGLIIKLLVRRFVLATSFTPFLQLYQLAYKLVIWLALRIFRNYPAIKSVYLRRGSAKGQIIPLISDVDFALIVNGINHDEKEELMIRYNKLAKVTTLLDKTLEIYDKETFFNNYETNNYFQYRFTEGRETWKLLYGKDYLRKLPVLPVEKMYSGFFNEIKVWWTIFEWRFLQDRKYSKEPTTRNNASYKAVSEILKMNIALNQGILELDRKKSINLSKPFFNGRELAFLEKLERIEKKHFRFFEPNILDETKDFLLNYLNNFYGKFNDHKSAKQLKNVAQKIDCKKNECFFNEEISMYFDQLVQYVKENWGNSYKGAYVIPSVYFNMDEFLLMIEINPERIPLIEELTAFNLFHSKAVNRLRSRTKLFLLLPNAAFQIDTEDFKQSWQSILCHPANPEVFKLLEEPEFSFEGEVFNYSKNLVYTPLVEHFLLEEKLLFYKLLENPSVYKLNNLDFLRIFWKTAQLVVINHSLKNDKVVYPLTLPSIERELNNEGMTFPDNLNRLSSAYLNELDGNSTDISNLIPLSIEYLKEINS